MRALIRRGVMVLLDLTNSSRELLLSPVTGARPHRLCDAISRLAYAFAQQEAETVAFTGDGLLAFMPDSGNRASLLWALTDALRDAIHATHSLFLADGLPVRLRVAIDYGEGLQVLDGPFSGHFLGRSIARIEEVASAARAVEHTAGVIAPVFVTEAAREALALPVHRGVFHAGPDSHSLSCTESLHQAHLHDLTDRSTRRRIDKLSLARREGLVMALMLQPSGRGPAFPAQYGDYLRVLGLLAQLASSAGAEVISIMPTGVFGFIEATKSMASHLRDALETLVPTSPAPPATGACVCPEADGLLRRACEVGWTGLKLAAGFAYGEIWHSLTGPLAGQSVGSPIVLAGRHAAVAAKHLDRAAHSVRTVAAALPSLTATTADPAGGDLLWKRTQVSSCAKDKRLQVDLAHTAVELTPYVWVAPPDVESSLIEVTPDDAKNLHDIGCRHALIIER